MDNNFFVINLGGSLIAPDGVDINFLAEFKKLLVEQIENKNQRFMLITGGGATARAYQSSIDKIIKNPKDEDKDWIGIHATRLNANLVRLIFGEYAYPRINTNPYDIEDFYLCKDPIMIAAGWKPGFSTDYDTVLIAKFMNTKKVVNLSNISYIYDKDPNKHVDAKKLINISWGEYREMIDSKWHPGMHAPFDPIAAKFADEQNLEVVTISGKDLDNFKRYLNGESFNGSTISND